MSKKYNRTPHLPWSEGRGNDDKVANDISSLLNCNLVITEKMDGSNVCLETDFCFARSHSGPATHLSFDIFKALHAKIRYLIPYNTQYFGELCYAKHSIEYSTLPGYFMLFGIREGKDLEYWKSWDYIDKEANKLEIPTVPLLWRGKVKSVYELESLTKKLVSQASTCGGEREGVVVRLEDYFLDKDFSKYVMKMVRKNHVAIGSDHWKHKEIVKNKLK